MPEMTTQFTGFGVGHLEALVYSHAGAEHWCSFDEADVGGDVADVVGIGKRILG